MRKNLKNLRFTKYDLIRSLLLILTVFLLFLSELILSLT